jgi:hypothetical protein
MKKYRRQGYAPEAAKLFFDYALRNYLTISMISIIDIRNIKSQRVAEKNGLRKKKKPGGKILRLIYSLLFKSVISVKFKFGIPTSAQGKSLEQKLNTSCWESNSYI